MNKVLRYVLIAIGIFVVALLGSYLGTTLAINSMKQGIAQMQEQASQAQQSAQQQPMQQEQGQYNQSNQQMQGQQHMMYGNQQNQQNSTGMPH